MGCSFFLLLLRRLILEVRKSESYKYLIICMLFFKNLLKKFIILLHFLIHVHLLMLCKKFELIPIFFYEFLKLLQNLTDIDILFSSFLSFLVFNIFGGENNTNTSGW